MNKLLGKTSRKITSIINIFLVIFQNFVPLFFLTTPVTASTDLHSANVSEVTLAFNSDSNELLMSGQSNEAIDYVLTYASSEEDAIDNAITGHAEITENRFEEKLYIGSCSTEECTPDSFDHGSIVFNNADYEANFKIDNEVLWLTHDNAATVARVSENVTYVAPQNDQVTVTFTELPENPGTLSIREVYLSDEQVEELGALSNVVFDITSSMENGTFAYDLKLPVPEGVGEDLEVVYIEDLSNLDNVGSVEEAVEGDEVSVVGLDHFTVFVVTVNPAIDCAGGVYLAGSCYATLQEAIDDAVVSDTIELASDISVSQEVNVNTSLTIDGKGFTIFSPFVKAGNSNNSAIGIHTDNVTIKNLTVDGIGGTDLHGINIYVATNILLDNVTANNYRSGVVVNGSTVTVNNITTSGNSWHGINVDLGSGVTTPAVLTVNGYSSHTDGAHIYSDHFSSDPVSIVDTMSQYAFSDGVTNVDDRLYTLQDIIGPEAPTILSPSEDQYFNSTPILNDWTNVTDDSGIDYYRIEYQYDDGHTFSGAPYRTTSVSQRNHTPGISEQGGVKIRVQAFDNEGNEGAWSGWRHYFYDATAPAVPTLTSPADGDYVQPTGLFLDWSDVTDPSGPVTYYYQSSYGSAVGVNNALSSVIYSSGVLGSSKINASGSADNRYYWQAKACDSAGNCSDWSGPWEVNIDSTAPAKPTWGTIYKDHGVDPSKEIGCGEITNTPKVTFEWNDNFETDLSGYWFGTKFNQKHQWFPAGSTVKTANMSPGNNPYYYTIIAVDNAGNESEISESCSLTLDQDKPIISWDGPSDGDVLQGPVLLEAHANETLKNLRFKWQLVGGAWDSGHNINESKTNYSWSFNPGVDGIYKLRAQGRDLALNWNKASDIEVTIDNTRPTGQIVTPTDGELVNGNLNVTGYVDDNLSGIDRVEVRLRNHPGNTYRTSWQVATLDASNNFSVSIDTSLIPEDDYEVAVVAYDKAGNNKWLWPRPVVTVDRTVPTTPVMNGFLNPTLACGSVTNINYTTVDWTDSYDLNGINKYHYSIDYPLANGSGFGHWETNLSQSQHSGSLNEGLHTIKVRALDNVGLYSSWSEECTITTDWTAPDITTDSIKYPNGTVEVGKFVTNYNTPTILGTTSSDVVLLELTVNGHTYIATVTGTDWEAVITDVLPEGNQTMTVVATDHAGNVTTIYQDIFIDTNAPTAVHTFYKDGTAIGGFNQYYENGKKFTGPLTYVQDVAQLSFTGEYADQDPSAGLYWDSYVIFEAQDDGSFRFSNDGKKAFCGWRKSPNLVDISAGSVFSLIDQESFANCESSLEDGEYYMAHHIYDSATRKDIPSINQFRDVLGLRFIVDTVNPTVSATIDPSSPDGDNGWYISAPTVTLTADDDQLVDRIEYQWNSDGWTTYSTPLVATEGTHTLYYRSYDAAENVSDEGSIVVKYDATSPNPGPENVRVSSFSLPTGVLEWDLASDGISGIRGYDVSWKLKGNDQLSFGKNVDATTKETELHSLTDGEWEIRVKALDEAGNWTEVLLLFTIDGASGESGGTTTTSSAPLEGTGGAILGVTTAGAGGSVLGETEEGETKDALSGEEVDLEGNVLGSSSCNAWMNYLPVILLFLQIILIIGFGLIRKEPGFIKLIVAGIITLITIGTFYFFKDGNCYLEKSALSVIAQWFALLSPITGFVTKTIVGGFTEEA